MEPSRQQACLLLSNELRSDYTMDAYKDTEYHLNICMYIRTYVLTRMCLSA